MGSPSRQEQEPPATQVSEVAPGVLRAQLPVNLPGLGHVNCYALEDSRGFALVDPGLPGRKAYSTLVAKLKTAGVPIKRVHTVVVTHSHHDHFGGAPWVRAESGADIVTHERFRTFWDRSDPPDLDVEDLADASALTTTARPRRPGDSPPWGGAGHRLPVARRARLHGERIAPQLFKTPVPTKRVTDREIVMLGGREWVSLHTPGHTEDHLCLLDPAEGIMLSGDHVLPTITPHIGGFNQRVDALDQFFGSLQTVASFGPDVALALPAHGHPFQDLAARANAIRDHHQGRLDLLRNTIAELDKPARVKEFSAVLFSPRAQGLMADSETFAHLEHLRRLGDVERFEIDGLYMYGQGASAGRQAGEV